MYIGGSMVSPVIGSISARFSLEIGIFIPAAAAVFVAAAGFGFLAHYKNRTH